MKTIIERNIGNNIYTSILFEVTSVNCNYERSISSKNLGNSSVLEIITRLNLEIYCNQKCQRYVQFTNPMNNTNQHRKSVVKPKDDNNFKSQF